jgi:hypothetical protein
MLMGQAKTGTDAGSCAGCNTASGAAKLADFFTTNLNVVNGAGTAVVTTADGMIFTFIKPVATDKCDTTVSATIGSNKCYVNVDVNGNKGNGDHSHVVNSVDATKYDTYSDSFYLVITPTTVVPHGAPERAALQN